MEIKANSNTLRCVIELNDNELIVNFNHENSLKDVLGFNVLQIEGKGSHEGINLANVNPVNSILVNCSAVQGSYLNGTQNRFCIHSLRMSLQAIELLKTYFHQYFYRFLIKI